MFKSIRSSKVSCSPNLRRAVRGAVAKLPVLFAAQVCLLTTAVAEVDPGIVGYWVLEKPGVINPSQTLTEFHADGTYVIHDTANGQSGTYEAINGNWSLTSKTSAWRDRGTYSLDANRKVLTLRSLFGVGRWNRFDRLPYFTTVTVDGQQIPKNVSAVLALAWIEEALPRIDGAVPVALEVGRRATGDFEIKMRFMSPATKRGLVVTATKFELSTFVHQQAVNWSETVVPLTFVELPRVIELLAGEGRKGPFSGFVFNAHGAKWGWSDYAESPRRDSVPTWITADGQVSHEPDDNGYIAQYNKDMEAARRSLAALIARNTRATGLYALYGCAQGDDACVTERQESEAFSETMCMLVAPYQDASSPPCVVYRYRGN